MTTMTNGGSTQDGDGDDGRHHAAQPPHYFHPAHPPTYGYPNYGYNTRNPPTNLWGPSSGANIAAMAATGQIPIPENVIIANDRGDDADAGSFASTLSMPNPMPMMVSNVAPPAPITRSFIATGTAQALPPQKQMQPQQIQQEQIQQQQVQQQQIQQQQMQQLQAQHQPQTNIQLNQNRAIHRINLSSIRHNYNEVQSSAAQQQCQVIVVVKADGYGHGAILSACHLVEHCGASAFAVATLEEGLTLRRAFEEKFPNPPRVRILVLGAPVGYPTCFDSYLHNNIELMVSGPEVAASLVQWMENHDGRRRAEVERVAERRKEELFNERVLGEYRHPMRNGVVRQISTDRGEAIEELLREKEQVHVTQSKDDCSNDGKELSTCNTTITSSEAPTKEEHTPTLPTSVAQEAQNGSGEKAQPVSPSRLQTKYNAATLTNVTGDDLAREVRQILIGQRHATANATPATATMATILEPPPLQLKKHQREVNTRKEKTLQHHPLPPLLPPLQYKVLEKWKEEVCFVELTMPRGLRDRESCAPLGYHRQPRAKMMLKTQSCPMLLIVQVLIFLKFARDSGGMHWSTREWVGWGSRQRRHLIREGYALTTI